MDMNILLLLIREGAVNGAIYALLAVALVLVFAVTRVIFIPQGEFVAFAPLTLVALNEGRVPGTVGLLIVLGAASAFMQLVRHRRELSARILTGIIAIDICLPLLLWAVVAQLAPMKVGLAVDILLTIALLAPMGPALYRIAFQPLAEASVLVLLIAAVGVHFAFSGLGLYFFGPEGFRTPPFHIDGVSLGLVSLSGQNILILATTLTIMIALWLFFAHSMTGKVLRASAINRIGASLVGVATARSGEIAFFMAVAIGAISGLLIGPVTTVYYDTGFLIGLKGFVAAILAGMTSFPLAVAAGIMVGLIEAFSAFWMSGLKEVIVFLRSSLCCFTVRSATEVWNWKKTSETQDDTSPCRGRTPCIGLPIHTRCAAILDRACEQHIAWCARCDGACASHGRRRHDFVRSGGIRRIWRIHDCCAHRHVWNVAVAYAASVTSGHRSWRFGDWGNHCTTFRSLSSARHSGLGSKCLLSVR